MIYRILKIMFVPFLFLLLYIPIQKSFAQVNQKSNRFQIAIGKDENVFEEITNKTDVYFLRCLIKQNWLYNSLKETERLNLIVWSTFYQNNNQENKYIIDFSNYYSHTWYKRLFITLDAHTQIKRYTNIHHGFWQIDLTPSFVYKFPSRFEVHLSGMFGKYVFFKNQDFNFNQYFGNLDLSYSAKQNIVINTKFILGYINLPNRKINYLAQNTRRQDNCLQAIRFSFTWQRDIFLNGFFQIENEESNYSGLSNSKIVFGLIPVFKLGTKWFIRGDFNWRQKSYKKSDEHNQLIGIDPEIGEGNDCNIDVVFMPKQRYSIIARINLQKHESILRNCYYSKNIFECILEIK